jgi:hypothetical protein
MDTQTTVPTKPLRKPRRTEADRLKSELDDTPKDLKRKHVETRETLTGPEVGVVAWVALVFCSTELGMNLDVWCDKILEIVYIECGTNNNVNTGTYWKKGRREYACNGRNDLQITVQETRDVTEEVEATLAKPAVWDDADVVANEKTVLQVCALKTKENLSGHISEFMRNAKNNVPDFYAKHGGILNGLYPNHHEIADSIKTVFESVHPAQAVMKSMILSAKTVILMVMEQCFEDIVLVVDVSSVNDTRVDLCNEHESDEDTDDEDNRLIGERRKELIEKKKKNISQDVKQLLDKFTQRTEAIESIFSVLTEHRDQDTPLSKEEMDAKKNEETELLLLKETVKEESMGFDDCMAYLEKPVNSRFDLFQVHHVTKDMLCVLGEDLVHLQATNQQRMRERETVGLNPIQTDVLVTLI